jgi:hypothetical protein
MGRVGRPSIGERAMTPAEKQRAYRERKFGNKPHVTKSADGDGADGALAARVRQLEAELARERQEHKATRAQFGNKDAVTKQRSAETELAQAKARKVEKARQRLVLCRLMIDIMRSVHSAYAPTKDPFGVRLETFFIGLCIGVGDLDGKPFSVAKIAAYMRVPRTTVTRRLAQLQSWGLIDRRGRNYYLHEKTLNSHGPAKLPSGARRSEQGYRGIDHFGYFAGLTQCAPPTEPLASERLRQLSGDAII